MLLPAPKSSGLAMPADWLKRAYPSVGIGGGAWPGGGTAAALGLRFAAHGSPPTTDTGAWLGLIWEALLWMLEAELPRECWLCRLKCCAGEVRVPTGKPEGKLGDEEIWFAGRLFQMVLTDCMRSREFAAKESLGVRRVGGVRMVVLEACGTVVLGCLGW